VTKKDREAENRAKRKKKERDSESKLKETLTIFKLSLSFFHNNSYFISSQSWHVSLGKINPFWQACAFTLKQEAPVITVLCNPASGQ
jgi:hypothetical protein